MKKGGGAFVLKTRYSRERGFEEGLHLSLCTIFFTNHSSLFVPIRFTFSASKQNKCGNIKAPLELYATVSANNWSLFLFL
jgi:hypothetical protein